ncbi:Fic family protein [Gemmatimonas sp.]|uniref:Fic family protein n=1 Tax=Gemmatimonas sp. TaxID=1962908 RepID=UPI00286E5B9C|nr:Fic family protein [Gemmatimonas sp.]
MKLPVPPPSFPTLLADLIATADGRERFEALTREGLGAAPGGRYRHWDTFRHTPPSAQFSAEEQWIAVKLARRALYRPLPMKDVRGVLFQYALPNAALDMLHQIERTAGASLSGNMQGNALVTNRATRDTYLFTSIVEEAITSSQLEGASTTRKVAKAMIQEGRAPSNRSERMILNNYEGMLYVRKFIHAPLTPEIVIELQRRMTEGTLDDPNAAGRFRRDDEHIVIEDETGTRLHTPPPAAELKARMRAMCDYANGAEQGEFVPPAVRALLLHFWLAYDHPFVDGNGRTARALFYWCMAREGYWLCEYVSISRILRKARAQYARSYLYTETDDNDATYFLLYQMRVLLRAIGDLHKYLAKQVVEMHDAEEMVRRASAINTELNPRQLALINHALKNAAARYTVESHRLSHGVSYETARSDLLKLVGQKLLTQRKVGKAFVFVPAANVRERLSDR